MRIYNIKKFFDRRKDLRNNSTPQEDILWSKLKHSQLGFKFRRQHSIGGYIVDFYCPAKRLGVEVDGPEHSKNENFKYDEIRTKFLEGLNIKTIRFSNFEVNTNLIGILKNIQTELNISPPCGGGD